MDDKTLIEKVNDGDRNAIGLLVEDNKNLVWHIIYSMVGHHDDCEDLFQEVFLNVFKGLRHFRFDARLSTWIGSITHHICVDYLRKKGRRIDIQPDENGWKTLNNHSPDISWKKMEREDLNRVVMATIAQLPPAYRTAVTLCHLDGLSYREIAEMTGMPDGTVKSYISRGRNLLREQLITLVPDIAEIMNDL
ncbi:MAG: RNA polymerase sigma factor [Candidatus Thorarchaeota archaeon]